MINSNGNYSCNDNTFLHKCDKIHKPSTKGISTKECYGNCSYIRQRMHWKK